MLSVMGWNPWAALRARDDIEFDIGRLPEGLRAVSARYPGIAVIALQQGLGQVERAAALAHELIHLEWGTHCQRAQRHLQIRDEEAVEDEVADRLVPPGELRRFWVQAEESGHNVHPHEVAEAFHVPERLAERAMRRLLARLDS